MTQQPLTDREIMRFFMKVCSRPDTFPDLPIGRPLFMSADWNPAIIAFARALLAGEGRE